MVHKGTDWKAIVSIMLTPCSPVYTYTQLTELQIINIILTYILHNASQYWGGGGGGIYHTLKNVDNYLTYLKTVNKWDRQEE